MEAGPVVAGTLLIAVLIVTMFYAALNPRPRDTPPSVSQFNRDDINRAALKLVHPRVPRVSPSYLGGTIDSADRAAVQLASLRREFSSFEPEYMRREILGWLDYYDRELAAKRADIVSGKSKNKLRAYRAERDAENERAHAVLRSIRRD